MPATISFGFACLPDDAGFFGCLLAQFMFYPAWLFVLNWVVGLADQRRYFFWASWLILTFGLVYLESFAEVLGVERPAVYDADLCRTKVHAVPDSVFVTTVAYSAVVFYGLWQDNKTFGFPNGLLVYASPFLYVAATIYTEYLSVGQVFVNLVISAAVAVVFIFLYQLTSTKP